MLPTFLNISEYWYICQFYLSTTRAKEAQIYLKLFMSAAHRMPQYLELGQMVQLCTPGKTHRSLWIVYGYFKTWKEVMSVLFIFFFFFMINHFLPIMKLADYQTDPRLKDHFTKLIPKMNCDWNEDRGTISIKWLVLITLLDCTIWRHRQLGKSPEHQPRMVVLVVDYPISTPRIALSIRWFVRVVFYPI